ncbi:hypothetical protein NDU88_006443 [Pleurodeles waltl]|uniref:Uncharacterized protein n=1 Tax=Pleurodeles waltl TaxID=8319 RepID=A0AAV7QNZ0_PLEWA|nr:hypothetical protein NDU88_006443 [Pleurodeles waltl]
MAQRKHGSDGRRLPGPWDAVAEEQTEGEEDAIVGTTEISGLNKGTWELRLTRAGHIEHMGGFRADHQIEQS